MSSVFHVLANGAFSQDWSNTGLISVADNWDNVPSIIGYRGDGAVAATGVDPQTVVAENLGVVNVIANQTNPNTLNTGGVAEFQIADPVVALQGSGTANAPFLLFFLDTTGVQNVNFSYLLRDIDGSTDNSIQPIALQYRVGTTGNFINIPSAFVADASSGPSLATLTNQINAVLPAAVNNQSQVQVRIITTNAIGNDEWIGIDNINITSTPISAPPVILPTVNLSVSSNAGSEAGQTVITVTATASSAVTSNQTVNLAVAGTGITAGDFNLSNNVISIASGQTTGTVTFTVVDDIMPEGAETAVLTISNPSSGITLGATVTQNIVITDNDVIAPVISANLVSSVVIPGEATDLTPLNGGTGNVNTNRLGGFGSDFFYDYRQNVYYGLADRGPGGGTIDYQTRVQQFSIDINQTTGAINSYQLLNTIAFTIPAGTTLNGVTYAVTTPFNGLNARLLNNNPAVLGASQDPEGFVVGRNGNFFVSDEYGPSIYEFSPTGSFIRAFTQPSNVLPLLNGAPFFAADAASTTGRQDNRGYEGLAISPDGTKLFGIFQDPLQQEGTPNGRSSQNIRIVRFDVASGLSEAQFIYQLEPIADINARIPGTANDFASTAQGRNIGVSSITAISDNEFLVIERDNRGFGVADPLGTTVVGSKRVYRINLAGATDVSTVSLSGTNALPSNVTPVSKSLFLDLASSIQATGQRAPEKIEGLAIGPQLSDGTFALVIATDNDFSVTQNGSNVQFDVYSNGISFLDNVPIGSPVPAAPAGEPAYTLIPSDIYSFKTQSAALNPTPLFDFSVAGFSVIEGNVSGFSTNATVRVTRRGSLANTDTVQLQLNNGTASAGSDFNGAPITVTFAPNESFRDVLIPVAGDTTTEPDETVNLVLANPSTNTVIGSRQPNAVLTIQNDDVLTRISAIQGAAHRSPLEGRTVTTQGIVTALATNGFYLQDPNPDNNLATSEGIFVFTSTAPAAPVVVGASLSVTGLVSEFRPGNNPENLTVTQIGGTLVIAAIASLGTITPTVIGAGGRAIPTQNIEVTPVIQTLQNIAIPQLLSEIQEPNITPNTNATGTFTFTLLSNNQVAISGSFSALTSALSSINLNLGAARTNGTVVGALTVTGTTGANTNFSGTFTLDAAQLTELQAGRAYVNVSSANFPAGELRGQLGPSIELSTAFSPATSGLDFFESLEGTLVQINNPVAVSPTNNFGEIFVLADNGAGATGRTARGGIVASAGDFNPERIQIDDDLANIATNPDVNVGATLSTVQGVVGYNFNNYEVQVTALPTVISDTLARDTTTLVGTANQLTIAAFNVQNLDPGDATFGALAGQIVNSLRSPDIISLEEIQDNNGATNNGVVDATVTFNTLIAAIATAGGPTYQFRQIDPVNNQDGGEPGGNIRVGFLFNPNRVSFVDRAGGTSINNTTIANSNGTAQPSFSPGRLQDLDLTDGNAFNSSRKPLVGEFVFNGQQVIVVGNHFNSKGGDQPLSGPTQSPQVFSETQRLQQAQIVNNFVDSVLAVNPNANIVVLGDINDFEFAEPTNVLRGIPGGTGTPVLTSLLTTLPANERYTFNFQGNAQVLDQILASNNLLSRLDGFDILNINSEFFIQNSDHDPSIARFNLPPIPTNNAPTVANLIADQAAIQGNAFSFQVPANSFADADAGDVLTFSATTDTGAALPAWLTFNATNRTFSGTPGVSDVGTVNVRVTATDRANATVSDVFIIATAPTIIPGIITGTAGNDDLLAGVGAFTGFNNVVFAGTGDDTVDLTPLASSPGAGGNRIFLGAGNDFVFVNGNDRISGEAGDDTFDAAASLGGNRLSGGEGNDTFFLGTGDRVLGDSGNDRFFVGVGGGNTIVGGLGNDQFLIVNGQVPEAANTISDFQIGIDTINLGGTVGLGITTSNLTLSQVGNNTAINFSGQTLAILTGIQANNLSVANPNQFVLA